MLHGKVYDVSNFVGEHPGGASTILFNAGNDDNASENFDNAEHSKAAIKSLKNYFIGVIESKWMVFYKYYLIIYLKFNLFKS